VTAQPDRVEARRRRQHRSRAGAFPAGRRSSTDPAFDAALHGAPSRMLRSDGREVPLAVSRWRADAVGEDGWLLDRCTGPVLDLGCGPGRLVAARPVRSSPWSESQR
jgi:hypothetical protein